MSTNDVITLSSDEEEMPSPKKRAKLLKVSSEEENEIAPKKKRAKLISLRPAVVKQSSNSSPSKPDTSCIVLSDDEDLVSSPKPADKVLPSTSTSPPLVNGTTEHDHSAVTTLYNDFINKCMENIKVPEHRRVATGKLQYMQDTFDKYLHLTDDFTSLQHSLEFNVDNVVNKPKRSLVYFTDVYQLLTRSLQDIIKAKEVIAGKEKIIKKLERTLAKIKYRINKLEKQEINFDQEENSSYIRVSVYKKRATEIHTKLCKYRKRNPNSGRVTYQRLTFANSNYPEINAAINRKYKNATVFPNYPEIVRLIRNCVNTSGLTLSDIEIQIESKKCFEKLGNFMQNQRKLELWGCHSDYFIGADEDPAKDNPTLQGKFIESYREKVSKETKLFEKFTAMQEKGVKCEDSEEASVADSDSDHDENNGGEANDSQIIDCITID